MVPARMRRLGHHLALPSLRCVSRPPTHACTPFLPCGACLPTVWRLSTTSPTSVAWTATSRQSAQLHVTSWPLPPCQSRLAPERVSTPAMPPRRAATSLSPSSRRPRYFYAIHGYKRRPPLHLIRNRAVSASGKPSLPHHLCFSVAPSVPSRLTPPLSSCAGPGAPRGPGAASSPVQVTPSLLLSSGAVAAPVSFHLLVARPPSCELVLLAMSGGFTMRLGCSW
jgi:hypothetical protein